jgi:hypothetical protein
MGLSWQQGPLSSGAIGRFLVPEPLPKRLLYAEQLRRRMRVRFGGVWIVDSEDVVLLFEPGRYPVAYFPERDVLEGTLRPSEQSTRHHDLGPDPPLARVGLNEVEARRQGVKARVATLPIRNVLRTETTGETRGFMKALVHEQRDDILGFTMLGAEAGEVMAVVQAAMLAGLPYTGLRDAILAHPTMSEGLNVLFREPLRVR